MWDAAVDVIVSSTAHAYSESMQPCTEIGPNSNVGKWYYPFGLGLLSYSEDYIAWVGDGEDGIWDGRGT